MLPESMHPVTTVIAGNDAPLLHQWAVQVAANAAVARLANDGHPDAIITIDGVTTVADYKTPAP